MKNWSLGINIYKKLATFLVVSLIFISFNNVSYAGEFVGSDSHIDCDPAVPAGDPKFKRPIETYIVGLGLTHTRTNLHQAVCNSANTTWRHPLVRVVYMVNRNQHRRDLRPTECKWIKGIRFCARMAYPKLGGCNHGNCTGEPGGEDPKPQLCAYVDPMDATDNKGSRSEYHEDTDVSTLMSPGQAAATGAVAGAAVGSIIPGIGTVVGAVIGSAVGALVSKIRSVKNRHVRRTLGCVDRPMAVGPPAWRNDAWQLEYLPPPTLDYHRNSTFASPAVDLHFCEQSLYQDPLADDVDAQNVMCSFMKDDEGFYIRPLTPVGDQVLSNTRTINITPNPTAETAVGSTGTGIAGDNRRYEGRIDIHSPDLICVYKTREVDGRNLNPAQLIDCLPRPGYMPLPIVTNPNQGGADEVDEDAITNPQAGVLGVTLNVQLTGMPGSVNLQYMGDLDASGDPADASNSQRCGYLHQILFCAKPEPLGNPVYNWTDTVTPEIPVGSGDYIVNDNPLTTGVDESAVLDSPLAPKATRYEGKMCIEGYETAPPVVARPFREPEEGNDELIMPLYDHEGRPVYDPPLYFDDPPGCGTDPNVNCLQNPDAEPVLKYFQVSELMPSYDGDNTPPELFPFATALVSDADPDLIHDQSEPMIPNNFMVAGDSFINTNTHQEMFGGNLQPVEISLLVDAFYYQPPLYYEDDPANPGNPLASGEPDDGGTQVNESFVFEQRPIEDEITAITPWPQNDPYYITGEAIHDYPPSDYDPNDFTYPVTGGAAFSPTANTANFDEAIIRPMTAVELGLCTEITVDFEKTYIPCAPSGNPDEDCDPAWTEYPNTEQLQALLEPYDDTADGAVNPVDFFGWEQYKKNDIKDISDPAYDPTPINYMNDLYIPPEDCSMLEVELWGAGAGGTSQPGQGSDKSGGGGAYIHALYDIKSINLVNSDIQVSIGIGGAANVTGFDGSNLNIEGLGGHRSTFGPNSSMIIAAGGEGAYGGHVGGSYTSCNHTLGCLVIDSHRGYNGTGHSDDCGIVDGGRYWSGVRDGVLTPQVLNPGQSKCDEQDFHYYDPQLHINTGLSHTPVPSYTDNNGLYYYTNLFYSDPVDDGSGMYLNPASAPNGSYGAGGGCASNACDVCTQKVNFGLCITGKRKRQRGIAAPGEHGKLRVRCVEKELVTRDGEATDPNAP
jgi:hypothetical protein